MAEISPISILGSNLFVVIIENQFKIPSDNSNNSNSNGEIMNFTTIYYQYPINDSYWIGSSYYSLGQKVIHPHRHLISDWNKHIVRRYINIRRRFRRIEGERMGSMSNQGEGFHWWNSSQWWFSFPKFKPCNSQRPYIGSSVVTIWLFSVDDL